MVMKTCSDCIHVGGSSVLKLCGIRKAFTIKSDGSFQYTQGERMLEKRLIHAAFNGFANVCPHYKTNEKPKEKVWERNCGNCNDFVAVNSFCRSDIYVTSEPANSQCGNWKKEKEKTDADCRRTTCDSGCCEGRKENKQVEQEGTRAPSLTEKEAKKKTGISFLFQVPTNDIVIRASQEELLEVRRIIDGYLVTDYFKRCSSSRTKEKIEEKTGG